MACLIANLPSQEVWVRKEYLTDHQSGHGEFVKGVWVSVKSIPAKAGEATKSEKAKADGASEATIQKLKDQENKAKDFAKGKKKRDEETDSTRKQNLTTYIKENE